MSSPIVTLSPKQIQLTLSKLKAADISLQNSPVDPVIKTFTKDSLVKIECGWHTVNTFTRDILLKKQLVLYAGNNSVVWDHDRSSEIPEGCIYVSFTPVPIYNICFINDQFVFYKEITDDEVVIIPKGTFVGTLCYAKIIIR